jgi:hypothetical protein
MFGERETGYDSGYIASVELLFDVKANCRRGNKFVELHVYPCRVQNMHPGYMGQWVDFNAAYKEAFRQALDDAFDALGTLTDSDDRESEAAWTGSFWPAAQNAEMQTSFLSPMRFESVASSRVFQGVTKFAVGMIELDEGARKQFDASSLQQQWINELSQNGQQIDSSSDTSIIHEILMHHVSRSLMGISGDPIYYFDESAIAVWQKNVVFEFNGELRRANVCIWGDVEFTMALPRDNTNAAGELVSRSIRSAAREFALRR